MLRELSVQNLALIEDARVELEPGYCAWTGETGAGKSLLLTALGLVLGGKATSDLVRDGKEEARAAAVFDLTGPGLRADIESILGGPLDDDQLILTRRISAQGRGSASANGLPIPAATLRRLGGRLIDIHGQHEGRALIDPEQQRDLLDAHGGLGSLVADYQRRRAAHAELLRKRRDLLDAAEQRRREEALLRFEFEELSAAAPEAGEARALTDEAHRLSTAEQFRGAVAEGYAVLYEAERSAQGQIEQVARRLAPHIASCPEVAEAAAVLDRLADEVREVAYTLRNLGRDRDDDPARLEQVESRLALYRRLSTRFRCDPDELAARLESIGAQLAKIDRAEADLVSLDAPLARCWEELREAATALTEARRKACRAFARAVQGQLKGLCLGQARLTVEVAADPLGDDPTAGSPGESGADHVEIVFTPNPGEPARPLRKIASGGELSRVTLAIKTILAGVDRVPTLVFDEIDTGVGGRLGNHLGRALAELARHHQVICVTHLPQMASYAAHQWIIRKRTDQGRTRTTIERLHESERVEELAVMLRGDDAAEGTRQEAKAMLLAARAGA